MRSAGQLQRAVRAELKKTGLLETERVVTRLQNAGLTESQRRDPINYEPGQVVEFHRLTKGGFKSGQQWEVLRREEGQVVVGRAGQEKLLPLSSAAKFNLYEREKIEVAPGDRIRVSKNFQSGGRKFRNNELLTVTGIEDGKITVEAGEIVSRGALHIDQGVCVTSHASQGKTVDQVIVSAPVRSFSHANEAQFYVSMSRARHAMYMFTDSKVALREAVCRPSARLSPWELLEGNRREKALVKQAVQSPKRRLPFPTVHAACWAHARRKFFEALKVNPKDQSAIGIVAQMDELFAIDGRAREQGLTQHDRQVLRLEKAGPMLEQIKAAIVAARIDALPKSPLAKACNYTLTLWQRLTRFLDYPVLELSNNLAENAIRPVALGRRNWIHVGSKEAGPRVAAIISVVETCRRLKIPVRDYLGSVLPGLGDFPVSQIAELTPAAWATRN